MLKDCDRSLKEIEDQKARIQSVVDDETKDDHDERKQKEVLEEYFAGQEDEKERLKQFYDKLCEVMVRAGSRWRPPSGVWLCVRLMRAALLAALPSVSRTLQRRRTQSRKWK